jgi:hypothetical protein
MIAGLREYVDTIVSASRLKKGVLSTLMKERARYVPKTVILELCMRLANDIPGAIVEFGVASGGSTQALRRLSNKEMFALDSFEGLRERFERLDVGHFAGPIPDIPGVNFVKGYFEDTCTEQLAARVGRVAFAHLDADLYNSTLFALHWLTPLLADGSLVLFDEFVGGAGAEARAFGEWQATTGTTVVRIAEFDREPSGGGDVPDKRLLFQVVTERPEPQASLVWLASSKTFLKASTAMAAMLSEAQKHAIRVGDVITTERRERHGAHMKIFGIRLNGQSLAGDWYILRSHWDLL